MKSHILFTVGSLMFSDFAQRSFAAENLSEADIYLPEYTNEEIFGDLVTLNGSTEGEQPVVGAFRKNIYTEQFFTDSVYYTYIAAFWTGYNMQSYQHALECLENGSLFLNFFHQWYLTTIYYRDLTELWDLFFLTAGTDANDAWYMCALFQLDFKEQYITKYQTFGGDFGNIYLSAIFNMLSNSLNLKSQTERMIEAYELHDTESFAQSLGNIMRSILDFESYTSVASASLESPTPDQFLGQSTIPSSTKPIWQREQEEAARIQAAKEKIAAGKAARGQDLPVPEELSKAKAAKQTLQMSGKMVRNGAERPTVSQEEEGGKIEWTGRDYAQIPLAGTIGALHALPSDTSGPTCSKNTIQFRSSLLEGFEYSDQIERWTAYYDAGQYLDEVGVFCQQAVTTTFTAEYLATQFTATGIPVNLLYNAGFMWIDYLNYTHYTPETVLQQDWAFFVSYLGGDFLIRIFYHDPTPQQADL